MFSGDRVKVALLGLGRLGSIRARILAFQQPRIELVAVCDTKPGTEKWTVENLPSSVKHFEDPQKCMKDSGAQAVLICTATATHAPLILQALDLGLHVMCEKPISVDIVATKEVVEKAQSRPDLKFLVPFTRRCKQTWSSVSSQGYTLNSNSQPDDKSYRTAKTLIDNGELGEIHAVETTCIDQQDPNGKFAIPLSKAPAPSLRRLTESSSLAFFVSFSEQSGGIFLDVGIHTVSICFFFFSLLILPLDTDRSTRSTPDDTCWM